MDRIDSNTANVLKEPEPPKFTKKIGKTTYEVTVHFSKTSKETMADKIKRLIQNDVDFLM